jgi:hypothetical protein
MARAGAALLALGLAACATQVPYPKDWGRLPQTATCASLAGTWADAGEYVGDKGPRAQSLAGTFQKLSSLRWTDSGGFDRRNLAIRIERAGQGQLSVTSVPASGGRAVMKKFRCEVVSGWARISEWAPNSVGGGDGIGTGGMSFGVPSMHTRTERLDFRVSEDGTLVARWLTRHRRYLALIPVDDEYERWARFKPYKPGAQSNR